MPTPGDNGGGGIWGWGGISVDPSRQPLGGLRERGRARRPERRLLRRRVDHPADPDADQAAVVACAGHAAARDFGFGSTPTLFHPTGCPAMAAAESKNGSVYIWQQAIARAAASAGRLPGDAVRAARMGSADADDVRHHRPGYNGYSSGLLAFRFNASCKAALVWRQGLGSSLDSVATVANDTVMVDTGNGRLRVFAASTGGSLASRPINGSSFTPPIAIGDDVATTRTARSRSSAWCRSAAGYPVRGRRAGCPRADPRGMRPAPLPARSVRSGVPLVPGRRRRRGRRRTPIFDPREMQLPASSAGAAADDPAPRLAAVPRRTRRAARRVLRSPRLLLSPSARRAVRAGRTSARRSRCSHRSRGSVRRCSCSRRTAATCACRRRPSG